MKKLLMIAFHYPPFGGGSGIHRTLKFSRYLPEYGWQPIVLTPSPNAYPRLEDRDIPEGVQTARAFALDTARHLSFRGAYPSWMAAPDRWMSWWPAAVVRGIQLIRTHRPTAIWSTYPIGTAHLIALSLHRWSGIPWVADFRDPMTEIDPNTGQQYPLDPYIRKAHAWIEKRSIHHASRNVFTTHGTQSMYAERFPDRPFDRWAVVPNGYDEEDFIEAEKQTPTPRHSGQPLMLVHSGALYPSERNPIDFFAALSDLRQEGLISPLSIKVVLRATGHDDYYRAHLRSMGLDDMVALEPVIPYRKALVEMLNADGLLIFQASNSNRQVPAKLYECLRSRRPIFAMTDPVGDTAKTLRSEGVDTIARLDSKRDIAEVFVRFVSTLRGARRQQGGNVERHSRRVRTGELAELLEAVSSPQRNRRTVDKNSFT